MNSTIVIETQNGFWSYFVEQRKDRSYLISGAVEILTRPGGEVQRKEGSEVSGFRSLPVFNGPDEGWEPVVQLTLRGDAKVFVQTMCFYSGLPVVMGDEVRYFGDMARTVLWAMNESRYLIGVSPT